MSLSLQNAALLVHAVMIKQTRSREGGIRGGRIEEGGLKGLVSLPKKQNPRFHSATAVH